VTSRECFRDNSSSCGAHLEAKIFSTHLGLVGLDAGLDGDLGDAVLGQTGDEDKLSTECGSSTAGSSSCPDSGRRRDSELKWIWRRGGGFLPLDGAVASLGSDAVLVGQRLEQLASSKVVAFHVSSLSSKVLGAVSWGFVSSSTGDLSGEDVESLGSCETSTDIGVCQGD